MLRRALVAFALVLPAAVVLSPGATVSTAEASVAIAASLEDLIAGSTYVVVGTPVDRKSLWEEIGGSRRIVTYTRIDVERAATGHPPATVWVRTLGGAVGRIGQSVSGEAQLATGQKALLFLADVNGVVVVVSRAQGHFVIGDDAKLKASPDLGGLVPRPGPVQTAREVLVGQALEQGLRTVTDAKARHDRK